MSCASLSIDSRFTPTADAAAVASSTLATKRPASCIRSISAGVRSSIMRSARLRNLVAAHVVVDDAAQFRDVALVALAVVEERAVQQGVGDLDDDLEVDRQVV